LTSNQSDVFLQLQQIYTLLNQVSEKISAIEQREAEILSILKQFQPFDPSEIQLKLLNLESQLKEAQKERTELNSQIANIPSYIEKNNSGLTENIVQEISRQVQPKLQNIQEQLISSIQANLTAELEDIEKRQSQVIVEKLSSIQENLERNQTQFFNSQANQVNEFLKQVSDSVQKTQNSESKDENILQTKKFSRKIEEPTQDFKYKTLENLLKDKQWQSADRQTLILINQACNKLADDLLLDKKDIEILPCTTLQAIDELWLKYSSGKFGFSVQKQIFESSGGKIGVDNYNDYCNFGKNVGWLVNNRWFYESSIYYSSDAPSGHLPLLLFVKIIRGIRSRKLYFSDFLSKLNKCRIG